MKHRFTLLCLLTLCLLVPGLGHAASEPWVLVDTERQLLEVRNGDSVLISFPHVALGRGGASADRIRGGNQTPLGEFRIAWVNYNSRYHVFLGFDFPTLHHARRAYATERLSLDEFLSIAEANRNRTVPPQATALGGNLGIHGIGGADEAIHRMANWTRGCIALTDEEMDKLLEYVGVGTRVVVR